MAEPTDSLVHTRSIATIQVDPDKKYLVVVAIDADRSASYPEIEDTVKDIFSRLGCDPANISLAFTDGLRIDKVVEVAEGTDTQ